MNLGKSLLLSVVMLSSFASTKDYMHVAFDSMMELSPYLVDEKKFTDPKSEEKIHTYIDNLLMAFKGVHSSNKLKTLDYAPSLSVMRQHLEETKIAFQHKQKFFARNRLNATQSLCITCHAQLKTKASQTVLSQMRAKAWKMKSDFERAESFYVLRDYPTSIRYYEKYIEASLEKKKQIGFISFSKIEGAFKRVLSYYTKTSFKPEKALSFVETYKGNKVLPVEFREDLNQWSRDLNKWVNDKKLMKTTSVKDLETFYLAKIEKQRESSRSIIDLMVLSGRVLNILKYHRSNSEEPIALYWLGYADRALNFSYYYSMADMYLVDCIEKFPRHEYGKKCLNQYKESIQMGFTGSAGENIPDDLKNRIKKYEQLIGN